MIVKELSDVTEARRFTAEMEDDTEKRTGTTTDREKLENACSCACCHRSLTFQSKQSVSQVMCCTKQSR